MNILWQFYVYKADNCNVVIYRNVLGLRKHPATLGGKGLYSLIKRNIQRTGKHTAIWVTGRRVSDRKTSALHLQVLIDAPSAWCPHFSQIEL